MQRRYKFLFFLIYKLKFKLFKKIESRFVKKIILGVGVDHSPRFNVRFKYLVFDVNKSESRILEKSRIIFHVLSVRALTRTLIFVTQAMPNSNQIYEISRLKLGIELIKNRKLLLENLVSHLSYDYLNFEEFSGMKLLTAIHIENKYLAASLKHHQAYVIEKTYGQKNYLKFDINDKTRMTALDKFIAWDLIVFIQFLKSNKLEETSNKYLRDNYPLLFIEISRYVEMEYVNHELSNFSFDDIYQKRGLDSFGNYPKR